MHAGYAVFGKGLEVTLGGPMGFIPISTGGTGDANQSFWTQLEYS